MYIVGIDENGFGPRLGVFTLTSCLFEAPGYNKDVFWQLKGGAVVDDSKKVLSFKNPSQGEKTALTFYKVWKAKPPSTSNEFLEEISLFDLSKCPNSCPPPAIKMCWRPNFSLPHFANFNQKNLKKDTEEVKQKMAERKIKLLEIKTIVCCPGEFNQKIGEAGVVNKCFLEFYLLEEFFKKYARLGASLFLCGKIGGTKSYLRFFDFLKNFRLKDKKEGKDSSYDFEKLGEIRFIYKGESRHFPIALASIFGKYVRELLLERLNQFFALKIPNLRPASGYNDPVTKIFISKTKSLREDLGIPKECFIRKC